MRKLAIGLTLVAASATAYAERDYISIVGSSTVYPFSTVVAETFGKSTQFNTPKIESTGSGGGLKLFCAGIGIQHPDITNASRRIKASEVEGCAANGVTEIIEVKIGYDGIVVANSTKANPYELTTKDLFLALAKEVPNPDGSETFVDNTALTWQDVNAELPATKIEVLGPPPTSGTRDAFVELAMESGCKSFDWVAALEKSDKDGYKEKCHTMREDGLFIEAGENDNLIVQKLDANPDALGIFGFSFLDENVDKVQGSMINGNSPTFEAIADGSYPMSRPLYFYAKAAHVGIIPGMAEFMMAFASEETWGNDGYLIDKGMIPMPQEERQKFASAVNNRTPLVMN